MSSIEGKPISILTIGFEISANAATSIMRYQDEQTIMKTPKNAVICFGQSFGCISNKIAACGVKISLILIFFLPFFFYIILLVNFSD